MRIQRGRYGHSSGRDAPAIDRDCSVQVALLRRINEAPPRARLLAATARWLPALKRSTLLIAAAGLMVVAATQIAVAASSSLRLDLDKFDRANTAADVPNGITLSYIALGDRRGPPVVLPHGYTDSARDWVPLIPYLDQRSLLIIIDLRVTGARASQSAATHAPTSPTTSSCCWISRKLSERTSSVTRSGEHRRPELGGVLAGARSSRCSYFIDNALAHSLCAPPPARSKRLTFNWCAEIAKLHDPIHPESPFIIARYAPPPFDSRVFL